MAANETDPRSGDTQAELLRKILTVLGGKATPGDTTEKLTSKILTALKAALTGSGAAASTAYVDAGDATTLVSADAYADSTKVAKAGDTMTGSLTFSQPVLVASAPALNLSQTWNNAAVTFTGALSNITNTASNSNSNLYNYQVGGEDRANFTIGGTARFVHHSQDGNGVNLILRNKGNTISVDGAILSDAVVGGVFTFSGFNGTSFCTGSLIQSLAEENWSNTVGGTRLVFQVTTAGGQVGFNALTLRATGASFAVPISIPSGANQRAGNLTLVNGTVTIANTSVTANTIVILTRKTALGTIGTSTTYTLSAGVSFTVTASVVTDTSIFSYLLLEVV